MSSAGQLLREERLKRKLNLPEIAAKTRISTRYLEAIEADNLEVLPGDFFYRSFLKQYALALDLDQVATDAILGASVPIPPEDPLPALAAYRGAQIETNAVFYKPRMGAAMILLAVVVVACSGLYAIWNKAQADKETPDDKETARAVAAPVPSPTPPPAAAEPQPTAHPSAVEPQATVPPSAAEPQATAFPPEPGKIQLDLAATETTWVSVSSEGKTVFSGVLDPSQTKNFAVLDRAKVLTGNAGGLDVRWNGKPIGPIGARGQVRTVVLRADHYEILPPRGM